MKYILLTFLLFALGIVNSQNCSYSFSGEIHDFHDGSSIEGATIYIESLNKYAISDKNGKFIIENLCKGEITASISHIGCETVSIDINLNESVFKIINLEHHIESLDEIKIEGHTGIKKTKTAQETILKTQIIEKYSAGNLGDALKEVSGVSSINTGNTIVKPVINGLHSSRIITLSNNVILQDQEWGIEHAPNVDINTAGTVSLIKGSGALAYGGYALGGVIVLNPNNVTKADSLYGKTILSAQTNGRGTNISSTLTKTYKSGWYINGQGTLKRYGDFKAANYYLTNTGLDSKSFSLNSGFNAFEKGFNIYYSFLNNNIGILSASHIGNIEDLVNAINNKEPLVIEDFRYSIDAPRQDVTHQIAKASFYKRFKGIGKLNLQYDYQNNKRFEYDVRVGDDKNKASIDLTLQTHALSSNIKIDKFDNKVFEIGFNGEYQNNFANPDTGIRRLIPDYDKYSFGAYATSEWTLNENTLFDAALRYDYVNIDSKKFYQKSRWEQRGYDVDFSNIIIDDLGTQLLANPKFQYHNISASTGLTHQFDSKNSILANYSLSNRTPNPSELFSEGLHHSAARIELGDLRIKQEQSNRFSASYNFNSEGLQLNLEGFYNNIHNFIYVQPTGVEQTIRGSFPVWEYQQTNAMLLGADLSLNVDVNEHFQFGNKTSYTKGRDLTQNRDLIDMPSLKTVNTITYNNKGWKNFNAELKSEWVFKQNEYPNNNFETYVATTDSYVLVDISTPPPAYHLLHFSSDITLETSKKTNLNIGLNISNIFNTSYREYLNRLRYFADDLGRNIMVQLKFNY
ncbi:TonB-dependent receptor [Mariniflexile gromovii]|uniref:TonB-dependent receptor n=1 Tax=Mariniflexile gromovii TaxID=362523 RepID=A0ABS4BVI7_9FLAO|nr:TonB-dependent receptor [Mariniflexile gromovii]MBP0904604.1 TonB-dependent receptor [Mariniflexile gromovii]